MKTGCEIYPQAAKNKIASFASVFGAVAFSAIAVLYFWREGISFLVVLYAMTALIYAVLSVLYFTPKYRHSFFYKANAEKIEIKRWLFLRAQEFCWREIKRVRVKLTSVELFLKDGTHKELFLAQLTRNDLILFKQTVHDIAKEKGIKVY